MVMQEGPHRYAVQICARGVEIGGKIGGSFATMRIDFLLVLHREIAARQLKSKIRAQIESGKAKGGFELKLAGSLVADHHPA